MQEIILDEPTKLRVAERADELFRQSQNDIFRRTDRLFAILMVIQWVAGIAAALWISPYTWLGATSYTHWHVWAAVFLGGAITSFPVFMAVQFPGEVLTRHSIAVGQMLTSALFIHLTGGRVETHFHVFGSLAFIACYRDWRVLATATVVVALDHFIRGVFWPESVFGVLTTSPWRWVEHAAWVAFENAFLFTAIRQSLVEMRDVAMRRANLEAVNASIERVVTDRTAELRAAHADLLIASRRAGMAEVATGVLHNVGNVLNSVNVSTGVVADRLKKSRVSRLKQVAQMFDEHAADLGDFLTKDERGSKIPAFVAQLADHLQSEHRGMVDELQALAKGIEHIKEIVSTQQAHASSTGFLEQTSITDLIEDALKIHTGALARRDITVVREFADIGPVMADKHKLLQIMVNLIGNATHAMDQSAVKTLTLTTARTAADEVRISVRDSGCGIAPENMTRIFAHGFTTKKDGHGFGLHSSALAASEMKGSLTVHSDGPGQGAVFTVQVPTTRPQAVAA